MRLKKLLTNNRLLVRLIISFLITSILLTSILMVAISSLVSKRIKTQTTDSAYDLLRQSYNTAEYVLTDIYGDYYTLWTKNESIGKIINSTDFSEEDIKSVFDIIDSEVFTNDLLDSIYVFNLNKDLIISNYSESNSIKDFYDTNALDLLSDFEKNYDYYKNEIFFPRKTSFKLNHIEYNKNYISIVYSTKDKEGKLSSGIIVNIDQNKISTLFNTTKNKGSMIIVNSSGKIISDVEGTLFAQDLPRNNIYKKIANSHIFEDSLIGDFFGEKSIITFKKAENIGFVFISITPYSFLEKEVRNTNSYIGIFFILAMAISLIISIVSIKNIYEPLNRLINKIKAYPSLGDRHSMDEYAFLGKTYENLMQKDKQSQVLRIFNGSLNDLTNEILGFKDDDKFITFAIVPDDESYITPNLLEEIIDINNKSTKWTCTITSQNCVSCIISDYDFSDEKIESIVDMLINLQTNIINYLNTTVSIGLGTVVNSIDNIKSSHRYAIMAAQYAKEIGENQVIYYNDIEDSKTAASLNKDSIADKIQEYIQNNFSRQDFTANEISEELDLSLGYLRQIFKNEKGITLNDYIINCRIDRAKELLKSTEMTAKEIAEEIGYYDNRYFYTLFKKKVGMTTDEYRNIDKEGSLNES